MGRRKLQGFGQDFQMRRVYRADQNLEAALVNCKDWPLDALRGLMAESWKVRGCDFAPPELRVNRRLSKTSRFMWDAQMSKIELAPNMMSSIVLMHELTHAEMLPRLREPRGISAHGPIFAAKHSDALGKTLGPRVEKMWREQAGIQGIRMSRIERGVR